jgi:DNA-cytosine methyltransferase
MKPLRILSLFDGISCGQVALERAEIPVEVYYASEIDKYAIQITQKNYPNTIQLGDINNIDFTQFIGKIDLIMGGSPCQDLSIAGKRAGLSGERSGLFYKFVEAIEVIKPKYFLLENNYSMPKQAKEEITRLMKVESIFINSSDFSAQNRKRLYWTNIEANILFTTKNQELVKNIIQDQVEQKFYLSEKAYNGIINSSFSQQKKSIIDINEKSRTLRARDYKGALVIKQNSKYRHLTPIEYERLQTLPDNYTEGVSNTQRYKAIGNGWTVNVIAHIFKHIKD